MSIEKSDELILVELPFGLLEKICAMRSAFSPEVFEALQRRLQTATPTTPVAPPIEIDSVQQFASKKYSAVFMGTPIAADSLSEVFAEFVDLMEMVAPDVLIGFARHRARTRYFISTTQGQVHPGRRDLPVMRTRSGWWISKNIGLVDLKRALKAMAKVSDLSYGIDIVFAANH